MAEIITLITRGFTYIGAQPLDDAVDLMLLPAYLAGCLRGVRADDVTVEGNRIFFKAGVFRMVSNWNVLVPFGFGELVVDGLTRQVKYRISIRQVVLMGTIGVAFMFVAMLAIHAWQAILFIPLIWLWIVGGNLLIGIPRFQRFLSGVMEDAPRKVVTVGRS
ncbi:MAG TPA: hypothetical protein VJW20_20555 [Candidatus Angelobacter sp.]|nr:hypothetical protein [Candidatus Angelobacter sp.]